jgi:pimeloyl-ACP methyl ester carboxylesterase
VDHRGHGSSTQPHFTDEVISPHTVSQCATDLHQLLSGYLDVQPHVLLAHSFGGKVALEYLKQCVEKNIALPKHTWIIDSIPGKYHRSETGGQSVTKLFQILKELPREFISKESMIKQIVDRGIDKPVALWLATNLVSIEGKVDERGSELPATVGWGFDLDTINELFEDFSGYDLWPFLENYRGDCQIHFLRAGKNVAWTNDILYKFEDLAYQNPKIKLHTMEHVGHWVHVEDLEGMLQLIFRETNL